MGGCFVCAPALLMEIAAMQKSKHRMSLLVCIWNDLVCGKLRLFCCRPNAWLTGAGARSAEGTDIGHENAEGMAYVGVRVEPPVRLGSVGTVLHFSEAEHLAK